MPNITTQERHLGLRAPAVGQSSPPHLDSRFNAQQRIELTDIFAQNIIGPATTFKPQDFVGFASASRGCRHLLMQAADKLPAFSEPDLPERQCKEILLEAGFTQAGVTFKSKFSYPRVAATKRELAWFKFRLAAWRTLEVAAGNRDFEILDGICEVLLRSYKRVYGVKAGTTYEDRPRVRSGVRASRFYYQFPRVACDLTWLTSFGADAICLTMPNDLRLSLEIKDVILVNCGLEEFPEALFYLKNLRELSIEDNKISEISAKISKLTDLEKLDIANNQLKCFPKELFELPKLDWLSCFDNPLLEFSNGLPNFSQGSSLSFIHFSSNALLLIPAWMNSLVNLTTLRGKNGLINTFSADISGWQKLDNIDLNNNKLTELPESLGTLSKLRVAFFENNCLTKLPRDLSGLKSLQFLMLNNNRITELPASIGTLASLQKLDLSHNLLQSLPAEIGKCVQLCVLKLNSNNLSTLPSSLLALPFLGKLHLQHNPIQEMPPAFNQLRYLAEFHLSVSNPFASNQVVRRQLNYQGTELHLHRLPVNVVKFFQKKTG